MKLKDSYTWGYTFEACCTILVLKYQFICRVTALTSSYLKGESTRWIFDIFLWQIWCLEAWLYFGLHFSLVHRVLAQWPNLCTKNVAKYNLVKFANFANFFTAKFNWYKYMGKWVILQSIRIIVIKSKETRVVTYTCRYSSGYLIPAH